jgi:hypothetical protein
MVVLIGIILPWGLFKLYLNVFHPLPTFSDVQLTDTGIGVTFTAHLYGQEGYARARFYDDGQLLDVQSSAVSTFFPSDVLQVKLSSDAFEPWMVDTVGTIKLFWCLNYDCSHEQLLQSISFRIYHVSRTG